MDFPRYLDHIRADGDLIATVAPRGLDVAVPVCAPWEVRDAWWWHEPDQTVGFWYRRMALETVVHRVDVESQFGPASAIDPDLALDGIDEVLSLMLAGDDEAAAQAPGTGIVDIAAGDATWSVALEEADTVVTSGGSTSPDATLAGDPATVFLALWGRVPVGTLTRRGDESRIGLMRSRLAAATQ